MSTPFTPENIHRGNNGRWYHDGIDITDKLITWRCNLGHTWQASIAARTNVSDMGCPECVVLSSGDRVDHLAFYLFVRDWTTDLSSASNDLIERLRHRWLLDGKSGDKTRQQYRNRAEQFLRVADGLGDGIGSPFQCGTIPPDKGDVCCLAPGHRGDNHRDPSGRTWPTKEV